MTPDERATFQELVHSHNLVLSHLRHYDAVFTELNNYKLFRFLMWIRPLAFPRMTLPRIVNKISDPIAPQPPPKTSRLISMDTPPEFLSDVC